jgi:hypothetical protein
VHCRTTIDGIAEPLTEPNGSRFGLYRYEPSVDIAAPHVTFSCKNTVVRNGSEPVAMTATTTVSLDSPLNALAGEAL